MAMWRWVWRRFRRVREHDGRSVWLVTRDGRLAFATGAPDVIAAVERSRRLAALIDGKTAEDLREHERIGPRVGLMGDEQPDAAPRRVH